MQLFILTRKATVTPAPARETEFWGPKAWGIRGRMSNNNLPLEVLRSLLDVMPDGVVAFDEAGIIVYCNPAMSHLADRPMASLLAKTPREAWGGRLADSFDDPSNTISDERVTCPDGKVRLCSVRVVRVSSGGIARVLLYRDITREKARAARRIELIDQRYQRLIQTANVVPWEMDASSMSLTEVGSSIESISGYRVEEWLTKRFLERKLAPSDYSALRDHVAALATGAGGSQVEFHISDPAGRRLWLRALITRPDDPDATGILRGFLFDITEIREAQERSRIMERQQNDSEKFESLRLLAGGVAHDFNNLLMAIQGNAGLAMMDLPEGQRAHRMLKQIELAATRASELTRELMNYSGKGRLELKPTDLTSMVSETLDILRPTINPEASIHLDLKDSLPLVDADVTRIRQVIMNLITNASDAIEGGNGIITVRTGTMEVENRPYPDAYLAENLRPGTFVFFEVDDSGRGIDAATKGRIFDPFFTTKIKGRGLGLASVPGILRSHGGALLLRTSPGTGTSFRVLLPCKPMTAANTGVQPAQSNSDAGTILIIDDETTVAQVASTALTRAGFQVLVAHDGVQGLHIFRQEQHRLTAILLDWQMPGMSGVDVFEEMVRERPELKVLFTSGYGQETGASRIPVGPNVEFLQKPFRPSELQQRIRDLIGRNSL